MLSSTAAPASPSTAVSCATVSMTSTVFTTGSCPQAGKRSRRSAASRAAARIFAFFFMRCLPLFTGRFLPSMSVGETPCRRPLSHAPAAACPALQEIGAVLANECSRYGNVGKVVFLWPGFTVTATRSLISAGVRGGEGLVTHGGAALRLDRHLPFDEQCSARRRCPAAFRLSAALRRAFLIPPRRRGVLLALRAAVSALRQARPESAAPGEPHERLSRRRLLSRGHTPARRQRAVARKDFPPSRQETLS